MKNILLDGILPIILIWMAQCYAWINATSGLLQFLVLPILMRRMDSRKLWSLMPGVMLVCATLMSYQKSLSLDLVTLAFSLYKALEYSVRGVTVELVRIVKWSPKCFQPFFLY